MSGEAVPPNVASGGGGAPPGDAPQSALLAELGQMDTASLVQIVVSLKTKMGEQKAKIRRKDKNFKVLHEQCKKIMKMNKGLKEKVKVLETKQPSASGDDAAAGARPQAPDSKAAAEKHAAEVRDLKSRLLRTLRKLKQKDAEQNETKAGLSSAERRAEVAEASLKAKESELVQATSTFDRLSAEVSAARSRAQTAEAEAKAAAEKERKARQDCDATVSDIKTQLTRAAAAHADAEREHSAALKKSMGEVAALQDRAAGLEASLQKAESDAQRQAEAHASAIRALESRLNEEKEAAPPAQPEQEPDSSKLDAETDALRNECAELKQSYNELKQSNESLKRECESFKTRCSELEAAQAQANATVDESETDAKTANAKTADAKTAEIDTADAPKQPLPPSPAIDARVLALENKVNHFKKAADRAEHFRDELLREQEELKSAAEARGKEHRSKVSALSRELEDSRAKLEASQLDRRRAAQKVSKLTESLKKYKEVVAKFQSFSERAQKIKADHEALKERHDALKEANARGAAALATGVPGLDASAPLADLCKTVATRFEKLHSTSGQASDEREHLTRKAKELEEALKEATDSAHARARELEASERRVAELEKVNAGHAEKLSKRLSLLKRATAKFEENKDKFRSAKQTVETLRKRCSVYEDRFKNEWFAPVASADDNGPASDREFWPRSRVCIDGEPWVLVAAGATSESGETLFWARQAVFLKRLFDGTLSDDLRRALAEDTGVATTLPNGAVMPACGFNDQEKRLSTTFERKWQQGVESYEQKLKTARRDLSRAESALAEARREYEQYKARAQAVLAGQAKELEKAMRGEEERGTREQEIEALRAEVATLRKSAAQTLEARAALARSQARARELANDAEHAASMHALQARELEGKVELLQAQISSLEREGAAKIERVRSEARAQSEKLVAAFRAEQERLKAKLAGEAKKNRAEAQAADAAPSPAAAPPASRGSNGGVVHSNDGDVSTAPPRTEPTAEHRVHIERLQKLLRDTEAKVRAMRIRERELLDQCGELKRSLARSEAGQSEYQKNVIVKYMENVAEQDSLLPVVATVLKLSDAEVKQIRERRNASRSFFSLNFL